MLRRLAALLLLSTTISAAAACTPATTRAGGGTQPISKPIPVKPIRPAPRAIDRAELRAALAARRDQTFARFLAYREAQIYPVNTFDEGFEHVWLDAFGNLCAAATIISGDWGRDVTSMVAVENNFIALAEVHDGPLADWILTSGLTHHEIVAIQVPGWQEGRSQEPRARETEIARLYTMYVDVERQLKSLWDESIDDATDALMQRPELAAALIDGAAAGPGRYAEMLVPQPEPTPPDVPAPGFGFAQPPPG